MQFIDVVKEAGIVGNGGAGFPTHIKLNAKVECFIVNAAECEPLIETDKYLIRHQTEELILGIQLIANHLQAPYSYIALKKKYTKEIQCLRQTISKLNAKVKIFEMDSFYPTGDEQIIVYEVTGKVVPERGIPLDVGAVVNNVGTVIAVYEAIEKSQPVVHKYLSVVGEVPKQLMLKVPLGTSVRACIQEARPTIEDYAIIMGGPMMGKVYKEKSQIDKLVITKMDGNILVLPKEHYLVKKSNLSLANIEKLSRSSCIQCKMCTDLCPRKALGHSVYPHQVMRNFYRERDIVSDTEYLRAFGSAINCSECGICELYACPMMLSPRRVNSYMKTRLREKKLNVERDKLRSIDAMRDYQKVPTEKLIYRVALAKYNTHETTDKLKIIESEEVSIPTKQHIGVAAIPVVEVGDNVQVGDLIAQVPEGELGANIHASISGVVKYVGEYITLSAKE